MRLTDENGNEYEFVEQGSYLEREPYGFLKPVDSWPKRMWHIRNDGAIVWVDCSAAPPPSAFQPTGLYRTKQEAEYAAERIRSLQEADMMYAEPYNGNESLVEICFTIPKKYLPAWQELADEQ